MAYKLDFDCYDAFWEPNWSWYGNTIYGENDDCYIMPYTNYYSYEAATDDASIYVGSNTKYIKNLRVTKIVYSDGSIWTR